MTMPNSNNDVNISFHREILGEISEINTEVQVVKRDLQNLQSLYTRVENSIVKLDSASNKLDALITVHERTVANIESTIRERESKFNKSIEDMRTYIDMEIREECNERKSATLSIESKFSGLVIENKKDLQDIKSKIEALDRFKWLIVGALTLISAAIPLAIKLLT